MRKIDQFLVEASNITEEELGLIVRNIVRDDKSKHFTYDIDVVINKIKNVQTGVEWEKIVNYFVKSIGKSNLEKEIRHMTRDGVILWTEIYEDEKGYFIDHDGIVRLPKKIKF